MMMDLLKIRPTRLYISGLKSEKVKQQYAPLSVNNIDPIPIFNRNGVIYFSDGYTCAFFAYLNGVTQILVYWDQDDLAWGLYDICISWCEDAGTKTIVDFKDAVISHESYKILWIQRCECLSSGK